ncbi:hypothetical protein HK105_206911 [Polyrhizophydium stewartii]|uniref:Rap-GAP domain-containing protein n=1 Tax=Polyrhizophydium stewartii TaxID=2732419 RepID=A0ABR4N281_9FUNG
MADDKRVEKLLRRARPFLDEKQKPKQRLKSLVSFLEGAPVADQARFFQEHDNAVFAVALDCFSYRVSRIAEKQDRERLFSHVNKDVIDLFETLGIFAKTLKFCKARILGILEVLLATGNHQKLRLEGLRLLLQYLACRGSGDHKDDFVELFADAIDLSLFDAAPVPEPREFVSSRMKPAEGENPLDVSESTCWSGQGRGALGQKPILAGRRQGNCVTAAAESDKLCALFSSSGLDKAVLYPAQQVTREEQCELIEETLKCIMDLGIELAASIKPCEYSSETLLSLLAGEQGQGLRALWTLFRRTYLRLLFPQVSRQVGLAVADNEGFELCPPAIMQILSSFIIRTSAVNVSVSSESSVADFAAAAIVQVVLGDPASLETVMDIQRQSLLMPVLFHQIPRSGLFLLASWICSPHKPSQVMAYLRRGRDPAPLVEYSESEQLEKTDPAVACNELESAEDQTMNALVRKFIRAIRLVFLDKPGASEDLDNLLSVYRDALDVLRTLSMEKVVQLEMQTWELHMTTLLEIQRFLLRDSTAARTCTSFVQYLAETVFIVWLRSRSTKPSLWLRLREEAFECTHLHEYVRTWADLTLRLTGIMADKVYDHDSGSRGLSGGERDLGKGRNHKKAVGVARVARENMALSTGPASTQNADQSSQSKHLASREVHFRDYAHVSPRKDNEPGFFHKYLRDKAQQFLSGAVSVASGASQQQQSQSQSQQQQELSTDEDLQDFVVEHHKAYQLARNFSQLKEIEWWNAENSLWAWKSVLCSIGRIRDIKIRQSQKFENASMPALFDFTPIIFEAADMPSEFHDTVVVATGCICRIMCRRHDQAFSAEYYVHFYRILKKVHGNAHVINSVLLNSQHIFALCLPSCHILIPYYLESISFLGTKPDLTDGSIEACIRILSSLICLHSHYWVALCITEPNSCGESVSLSRIQLEAVESAMTLPKQESSQNSRTSIAASAESLGVFRGLDARLLDLIGRLLAAQSTSNRESRTQFTEQLLWIVGVMTLDACLSPNRSANPELVNDCIAILLDYISLRKPRETRASLDCLSVLSQNYDRIRLDTELVHQIINRIVFAISESLQLDDRARKQIHDVSCSAMIVSMLFRSLVDWLSSAPKCVISNPNIALRVSEVVEEAIHVSHAVIDCSGANGDRIGCADDEPGATHERSSSSTDEKEIASQFKAIRSLTLQKACAEHALIHLLHHVDNFAPINGPAMMHSLISEPQVEDDDADPWQYFTFNDQAILSFADMQKGSRCRIIMRDASGKYVWDLRPFYRNLGEVEANEMQPSPAPVRAGRPLGSVQRFKFNDDSVLVGHAIRGAPEFDSNDSVSAAVERPPAGMARHNADALEQLLLKIGSEHPDCLQETQTGTLNSPALLLLNDEKMLSDAARAVQSHVQDEVQATTAFRLLLLSQLGFLTFDFLKSGDFHMLSKTPSLIRDIKGLDRKPSREVAKVAVIYVAPGQEDEQSIFRNSCGSYEYDEFVASLGWERDAKVDLANHPGYLGGLERSMVNGGVATYFCTSTLEIMFHDVTKMPTDPADPKQLKKAGSLGKRHIGNDHVHIIWNEHFREYKWDTIGGDFGNAQIAITPLADGMFAVDTYRDDQVRPFGPLLSHAVISKALLGPLVRATAIHAYHAALFSGHGKHFVEPHPFAHRKETIGVISSRHKLSSWTYERLTDQVFTNGRDSRQQPSVTGPQESSGTIGHDKSD